VQLLLRPKLGSEQRSATLTLGNTTREYQAKIDDLTSRLLSVENRVGDKNMWDLSSMIVTPNQVAKKMYPRLAALEEALSTRLQALFTGLETQLQDVEKELRDRGLGNRGTPPQALCPFPHNKLGKQWRR
jgi:hypothetical protein